MSLCGRKVLTLLSSVFAVCALGLLGIAVSTDYWLYLEEGIILPLNQTTDMRMSLHSGLWRVCFLAGKQALCLCESGPSCPSAPFMQVLAQSSPPTGLLLQARRHDWHLKAPDSHVHRL